MTALAVRPDRERGFGAGALPAHANRTLFEAGAARELRRAALSDAHDRFRRSADLVPDRSSARELGLRAHAVGGRLDGRKLENGRTLLKRSPFIFGFLTDGDVEGLANVAERREFGRGDVMIRQGEHSGLSMFVIDGAAEVVANGRAVNAVSTGDVRGEISLFDSRPPSATVTALDDVTVLDVPFETLRARLAVDPELASRLYFSLGALLSQRMRERLGSTIEHSDEIDPEVMDKVALAGRRLEMMQERAMATR